MELVSFAMEVLQSVAERAASYRVGQTALRYLDRGLWIVEKSARWAVPPPLDQDERPQPELIRPLPWVFFLALLVFLRIMREMISLINLAFGKPPLRSADVVIYIQSKRRYLRTLKYQGSRAMRARSEPEPWLSRLRSLANFTMCFRRHYGNNNTQLTNGDEVLVVKRRSRGRRQEGDPSMERLIERMMLDVDADSDESSSYTLTNITGARSDRSDRSDYNTESDQDVAFINANNTEIQQDTSKSNFSSENNIATSTPENENISKAEICDNEYSTIKSELNSNTMREATLNFIQNESGPQKNETSTQHKIANGKSRKRSPMKERYDAATIIN